MDLVQLWDDMAAMSFLENLIANELSPASLENYIAILSHFFSIYGWLLDISNIRRLMLMVKSVRMNSNLKPKIKGVLTVNMLKKIITHLDDIMNAVSFK